MDWWARGQVDTCDLCIWRCVWKGFLAERLMHKLNKALKVGVGASFLGVGGVLHRPRWRA